MLRHLLLFGLATSLTSTAFGQFVDNTTDIPQGNPFNASRTENVDFADVDLDGDWDAAFAEGGDDFNDQNRLWINQGGVQGGTTGVFEDETAMRCPAVLDQSRDVEFVDFDGDGDPDLYVSNTAQIVNQSNRWWTNLGGLQGGNVGYYAEETAERWVGLGESGSSISPIVVLFAGGFIDWSCDSDFGDLDNDGDLDLVHSSYGGAFGGQVPTRMFLNDGAGYFREFNPSGFQLTGTNINNGDPGLWCEGIQEANTMDSSGAFCDVASSALDIELGDIDGDFDLDLIHGARQEPPRMFANRLEGSGLAPDLGGGLLFRDVTSASYPDGYVSGAGGHYEQEAGDLDGDGDLDLFGLNWIVDMAGFHDITLVGVGDGTFVDVTPLGNSNSDDNEGDFLDYDSDGDLDLYVTNWSGQDRLYRNENNGGSGFAFVDVTAGQLPPTPFVGLDADAADLDADGDYDLMVANNLNQRNMLLENVNDVPDTLAPYIPHVEQAPDRPCDYAPTVLRAHVYDNAPYYVVWYHEVWVEVSVDGGPSESYPAMSSGGQVFRAELPGTLSGSIQYTWHARDEHGNQGTSAPSNYLASGSCAPPISYCEPAGANSVSPGGAHLSFLGGNPGALMSLQVEDAPPGQFGVLFFGTTATDLPFGCGRRCVGGAVVRSTPSKVQHGASPLDLDTSMVPAVPDPFHLQFWFRDPAHVGVCGSTFNLSNALTF